MATASMLEALAWDLLAFSQALARAWSSAMAAWPRRLARRGRLPVTDFCRAAMWGARSESAAERAWLIWASRASAGGGGCRGASPARAAIWRGAFLPGSFGGDGKGG